MQKNKQLYGMAAALIANLIFGFSFVFSKMALTVASPLTILAVRFTIAFIALNILMFTGLVKIQLHSKPKHKLIAMGIAQPLLYFIFELYGLSLVSSALSGIIIALVPVLVLLFSGIFLNEKPSRMQFFYTALSILGVGTVSFISNDGGKNHFWGILFLLGAVVSAAAFNLLSRGEAAKFSPFERTYIMFLIGCIGFNIIAMSVLRGRYFSELVTAVQQPEFIIAILYLAVISSVAAFMLYNFSTSAISAVRSSSFSNIITVVSVAAGVFILKETFSYIEALLCIPIIIGVYGVNKAQAET